MEKTMFAKINIVGILILTSFVYCYGSDIKIIKEKTLENKNLEKSKKILYDYETFKVMHTHGILPSEAHVKEEEENWKKIITDISMHEHEIVGILQNGSSSLRMIAGLALEEIKSSKAVTALSKILENTEENIELRRFAARSLGKIGDRRTIGTLKEALKNASVSIDAAYALADFGDPAAIEPLLAGLRKSKYNTDSFYTAVAGLEKLKDLRAVELLVETLRDCNHEYSRNTIARALYNILSKNFGRDDLNWMEFGNNYKKWQAWWEQNKKELTNAK